jgi:copper resistance protein B
MSAMRALVFAGIVVWFAPAAVAQTANSGGVAAPPRGMDASEAMPSMMDRAILAHLLAERLEGRFGGGGDFRWDGQGWIGTDYDKLWIKSEGFVRATGQVDDGRHEFLYDRAVSTYFDLQGGIRSDIDSHPTRNWAALGVQGLAPFFFDVEATGYLSDQGHFAGRVRASCDILITQRLILQPEAELNLYGKSDTARLIGAGVSDVDAGIRLRYEIDRKLAPYIGVAYEGKFGQTAEFARKAGDSTSGVRFLLGIRTWF